MKHTRITSRYAKSLLFLSIERDILDNILEDMKYVQSIFSNNRDFTLLLKSPIVKTEKKQRILKKIFSSQINEISMKFISILTAKKRELYLEGIAQSFINQYKSHKNIEDATIITAVQIDDMTKREILSFISKQENKKIQLKEIIDENIIGGAIIKMGDKQLDTSISKTIKQLKQTFNKNLYIQDY